MTRKLIFLTIIAMVVLISLLVGCSSTPAETTPTPDTSIVWSDDFEDGDTEGWEEILSASEYSYMGVSDYFVKDGILNFPDGGDIIHPSTVTTGTWSFDVFVNEGAVTPISFDIFARTSYWFEIDIFNLSTSLIMIEINEDTSIMSPAFYDTGEILTGWHHFDVTRDDVGLITIYLDGVSVLEHPYEISYEPEYFWFGFCCEGPALDNVVVRNQVIDIQPAE